MPEIGDLAELSGSDRKPVAGATRTGDANPGDKVLVTVIVRRRPGASFTLAEPPAQGGDRAAWRREQRARFAETDGASQADVDAVAAWAREAGMEVRVADPARRTVTLEGSVAQANRMFGVSLGRYRAGDLVYRGREGRVSVPRRLLPIVDAVLGLDNRPVARPHHRVGPPIDEADLPEPGADAAGLLRDAAAAAGGAAAKPQPLWAMQVAQAYGFPADVNGSGESIAIIELGGGFRSNDLDAYFARAGITKPNVVAVSVDNGSNAPGSADDGEVLLDIEVSGSVAPSANIVVYFADKSDNGFADAIGQAVHDPVHAPSVISISWGGPEDGWSPQSRQTFEGYFQDAAKLGVTVLVASGDHGAGDAANDTNAHADYPASSPQVVGCGGTTLTIGAGGELTETVWNDGDGWATGGGISDVFPVPAWQQVDMPANLNGSGPGRGVPDVAGNADITSGYVTLIDGKWNPIGGTSAVAPLYAGLVACINQAKGQPVGELASKLYSVPYTEVFRDVQTGNNRVPDSQFGPAVAGYTAGPGWDACTGLGSVNGSALRDHL